MVVNINREFLETILKKHGKKKEDWMQGEIEMKELLSFVGELKLSEEEIANLLNRPITRVHMYFGEDDNQRLGRP